MAVHQFKRYLSHLIGCMVLFIICSVQGSSWCTRVQCTMQLASDLGWDMFVVQLFVVSRIVHCRGEFEEQMLECTFCKCKSAHFAGV